MTEPFKTDYTVLGCLIDEGRTVDSIACMHYIWTLMDSCLTDNQAPSPYSHIEQKNTTDICFVYLSP